MKKFIAVLLLVLLGGCATCQTERCQRNVEAFESFWDSIDSLTGPWGIVK